MPLTQSELITSLLQLNNPQNPFTVRQEGDEVVATWNIVDAQWLELFAKAGMKETFEIRMKFDEAKHEVQMTDRTGTVKWEAGVPQVSFAMQQFKGKKMGMHKSIAFGVKPDLSVGEIYNFDFNTGRIKNPIQQIIQQAGWTEKKSFLEKMLGF